MCRSFRHSLAARLHRQFPSASVAIAHRTTLLLAFFLLISLLAVPASAATWTETGTSPASWNVDANWGAGPFPNAVDAAADMNVDVTVNQTVNLNLPITVGSLNVGDTNLTESITIAPNGGSLTFDVTTGNGSLTKAASTSTTVIDTISAPVILSDNLTITNNSAFYFTSGSPQGMVRLSGGISDGGAGKGITKGGPGTVSLQGGTANTYSGATVVTQGTLLVQTANSIPDASPVNVIATGAGVQAILRWGLFNAGVADTIGPLTLGGTTTTSQAVVNVGFPAATTLTLGGNVIYDATNNPLGALMGVSGMSLGRISLGGATRTFTVGDSSSAGDDLSINQPIISGNLVKDGPGTLAFGVANNSLTNVWVKEGRAVAYQPGGMSASVTLGDSSGSDNVIVHMERGGGANIVVAGGNTGTATLSGHFGIGGGTTFWGGTIQLGDINGAHDLTIMSTLGPVFRGNISGDGNLTLNPNGQTLTWDTDTTSINHDGALDVVGAGTVNMRAVIGPNVTGLNKAGASTMTLNGANVHTFTSGVSAQGGTLALNFANLAAPTNLIDSANTLTFGPATVSLTAKNNQNSSQTFNGTVLSGGRSNITAASTGTGEMNVNLATLTRNNRGDANFTLPALGSISVANSNDASGILGPWATVGAGVNTRYATVSGGAVAAYSGETAAGANLSSVTSSTTNYTTAVANTLAASQTGHTLRYTGGATTTGIGTNTLTLNGLLHAGTGQWTFSSSGGGSLAIGATNELVVNAANNTIRIDATITGSGAGLTKTGGGELGLSGNNSYNGTTVINAGGIRLFSANGLGSASAGVVVNSGGTLHLDANNPLFPALPLTINGGGAGGSYSGALSNQNNWPHTWRGNTTLGSDATIGSNAGGTLTLDVAAGSAVNNAGFRLTLNPVGTVVVNDPIIGSGGLSVTGGGTALLDATNTYTGTTIVTSGTLRARDGVGMPSTGFISLNPAGTNIVGVWASDMNINRNLGTSGAGNLAVAGGGGTFTGFAAIGAPISVTLNSGAELTWGMAGFNPARLLLQSTGSNNRLTFTNSIDLGSATREVILFGGVGNPGAEMSGAIRGAGGLTKLDFGTLILSGTNTFTGALAIRGTVQLGNGGTSGSLSPSSTITHATSASTLAFNRSDTITQGTHFGNITNQLSVVQLGAGVVVLNSAGNTYSGSTLVSGQTLRINGATALPSGFLDLGSATAGGGVLELQNPSSFVRALGTTGANIVRVGTNNSAGFSAIGGPVTVNLGSGSPNPLIWGSTAGFNPNPLVLNAATANDKLTFQNNVNLNGAARIVFVGADEAEMSGVLSNSAGTSGLTKTGAGTLILSNANTYNGPTDINAGTLLVNGTHTGGAAYTVGGSGTLGGTGRISSLVTGSGLGSPGNSPGIFAVSQTDPSAGMDFAFELTQLGDPTWNNAGASGNDVWRSTHATDPFAGETFDGDNVIDIYFGVASLVDGDVFRGGFYTDLNSDFFAAIMGADYNYWVLGDGAGSDTTFESQGYYSLASYDAGLAVALSTVQIASANFTDGTIPNGWVMQFDVNETALIPEPSTLALAALGLLGLGLLAWRRKEQ